MHKILILGASGFVGGRLAKALLAEGYAVRCVARNPAKVADLDAAGAQIVQGDIADAASMMRAVEGMEAVYISIHTISPQPNGAAGAGFMDIEIAGLENLLAACRAHGVRRLIYVTFLGVDAASPNVWVRRRARAEQLLLTSGLDATCIRPGQIVGRGGRGFGGMVVQARKRLAVTFSPGRQKMRNIAISDLLYYLIGVLEEPRAYGQAFDVGNDEVLTNNQMVDIVAAAQGRRAPLKISAPRGLMILFSGPIERRMGLARGTLKAALSSLGMDAVGDPLPIRALLPRPLLTYRQAVDRALAEPAA